MATQATSFSVPSASMLSALDGTPASVLFWHRRDLRIDDNEGLFHAVAQGPTDGVFVFDPAFLDALPREDRRVEFILSCVQELSMLYAARGRRLWVLYGQSEALIPDLAKALGVTGVFTNKDYEPSSISRDEQVEKSLHAMSISFSSYKDHVIFEAGEIKTGAGGTFAVFTPYKNAWLKHYALNTPALRDSATQLGPIQPNALKSIPPIPSLSDLGFTPSDASSLGYCGGIQSGLDALDAFEDKLQDYAKDRDFPYQPGTSRLGHHLRFGTLSIRSLVAWGMNESNDGAKTWVSELVWRDFYATILATQPRLASGDCYIPEANQLQWDHRPDLVQAWKEGRTGYPLVDAAMRELTQTGYMHNRARMVTASFLTKDLLCDWHLGEAHFAQWLMDFDFASNNGGWQWSASTGCDAQPYFRIFSPTLQSTKFDPLGSYIKKWVPELKNCPVSKIHEPSKMTPEEQAQYGIEIGIDYPAPIVSHAQNRLIALERYKQALS